MINAWNVQFEKEGRTVIRVFEGDSPNQSGALPFAKELKKQGLKVELISRRHAFPPVGKNAEAPSIGLLWCPYCIKWREFEESSVVRAEYETPSLLRCVVCLISIKDYYVRMYNSSFVDRLAAQEEINRAKAPTKPVLRKRRR